MKLASMFFTASASTFDFYIKCTNKRVINNLSYLKSSKNNATAFCNLIAKLEIQVYKLGELFL